MLSQKYNKHRMSHSQHQRHNTMDSISGSTTTQQQHRRQNSTPVAHPQISSSNCMPFTPASVNEQSSAQWAAYSHRRGISLDDRNNQQPMSLATDHDHVVGLNGAVSMTTTTNNLGQQHEQHNSQVTQRQYLARPGILLQQPVQQHVQQQIGGMKSLQQLEEEFRQFQHRQLDAQLDSLIRGNQGVALGEVNSAQHAINIERSRSYPDAYANMSFVTDPEDRTRFCVSPSSAQSPSTQEASPNEATQRPTSSRSDTGNFERNQSHLQPSLQPMSQAMNRLQRTSTPRNRTNNNFSSTTPATTTYHTAANVAYYESLSRSTQASQVRPCSPQSQDPDATLRASKQDKLTPSRPLSEIFGEDIDIFGQQQAAELTTSSNSIRALVTGAVSGDGTTSPEKAEALTGAIQSSSTIRLRDPNEANVVKELKDIAAFESIPELSLGALVDTSSMNMQGSLGATKSIHSSPQLTTIPSSPEMNYTRAHRGSIDDDVAAAFSYDHNATDVEDFESSPTRGPMYSPRSQSLNDLSLDCIMVDTGITDDEVQAHISEPDPISGKWKCMYPDCGEIFGRKENIRAHVQTHLGDRKFQCLHCIKRFVRAHDLKRHSKIHSGVKPYPCQCGQSFARHDALTRHRQRGICPGKFEGVVKKVARRGRPRKERPEDDERANKAALTRQRAKHYASSVSGTSECSSGSFRESPEIMMLDEDYGEFLSMRHGVTESQTGFSFGPNTFNAYTPPMSPYSCGNVASPAKSVSTVTSANSAPTPPGSASFEENLAAALTRSLSESRDTEGPSSPMETIVEVQQQVRNENNARQVDDSQPSSPPGLTHSSPPSSTRLWDLDILINSGAGEESSSLKHTSITSSNENVDTFDFVNMDLANGASADDVFASIWDDNIYNSTSHGHSDKDLPSTFSGDFDDNILFPDSI